MQLSSMQELTDDTVQQAQKETTTETPLGDEVTALQSLGELLDQDAPEGDGTAGGDAEKNAKPARFNELAEATGLKLDDLYKLTVTTNAGEAVSIEELKALQGKHDEIVLRDLEWQESKAKQEAELRRAQNELADIVQALPKDAVRPEVLDKIRQRHADHLAVERQRTLEAIPASRVSSSRQADIRGMAEHLQDYGFPANYLQQVVDQRQLQYIRDSYLREQRVQSALQKVRAGKPNPTPASKTTGQAPQKRAAPKRRSQAQNNLEAFFSELE